MDILELGDCFRRPVSSLSQSLSVCVSCSLSVESGISAPRHHEFVQVGCRRWQQTNQRFLPESDTSGDRPTASCLGLKGKFLEIPFSRFRGPRAPMAIPHFAISICPGLQRFIILATFFSLATGTQLCTGCRLLIGYDDNRSPKWPSLCPRPAAWL